jgi:hypothetical protein
MKTSAADTSGYAAGILRRLRMVWQELLKVSELRLDDDFFRCGGHSHLALLLTRELNKEFGLRLNLRDIYVNRTLGAQLELIDTALAAIDVSITYDTRLLSADTIGALADALEKLLTTVADNPDQYIGDIGLHGYTECC